MPKRPNPFGNGSPLQLKSHIGVKEVDMGVNKEQNMQTVYDKTKSLLFEGSKKAQSSSSKQPYEFPKDALQNGIPQPLPGQLRLDSTCHLCVAGPNGTADLVTGATAVVEQQDEGMDTDGSNTMQHSTEMVNGRERVLQGQLFIDPEGHLCSGIKVNALVHRGVSPTLGFHICQSCNHPSNVGARPCHFCDKLTCNTCLRQCHNCSGLFCPVCSTLNYNAYLEKSYCLQCCND